MNCPPNKISIDGISTKDQGISKVPDVALCATSNNNVEQLLSEKTTRAYLLDNSKTSMKGPLLGIIKPSWIKVAESESRLEDYAKSISFQLRTEEMKLREEERTALLDLMLVKIRDEKRNLRILLGVREEMRKWLKVELGRKKFNKLGLSWAKLSPAGAKRLIFCLDWLLLG